MQLRRILTIIMVCTLLTACGSSEVPNSLDETMQDTVIEKDDKKDSKEVEKEVKEIKISGSGELTEDMVIEILSEDGIDKYDYYSTEIYDIILEDGFTKIGNFAFKGYRGLQTIAIPDSVTEFGSCIFADCTNLQKVTIPDSVTDISNGTFIDCTNLQEVKLPENITELDTTFRGCTSLQTVIIPENVSELRKTFEGCTSLQSITLPENVSELSNTFKDCTSLQSITLPESITGIGYASFSGCTELTEINIPDNVEIISEDAFYGCTNLVFEKLDVLDVIIGNNAFKDVTIKELVVVSTFGYISDTAFSEANIEKVILKKGGSEFTVYSVGPIRVNPATVTEIEICDGCVSIGDSSFKGLTELKSIIIPASVTEIHSDAFIDCSNLTIYTTAGSAAEAFAIENGVPYGIEGQDVIKRAKTATGKEPFEYKELPEDAAECVAIADYLIDKSTAWVVYDIVITDEDEITTISVDIPDRMKGLEGDSYIVYAFEGTDFEKRWCECKNDKVSFLQEGSGVYAVVQYDSNVWLESEFVEHSDLIVEEERYVEKVMITTQQVEVLDMAKYGLVIGTLPANQKVEIYSSVGDWAYIYYGNGKGSVPYEALSDITE